jgi:hypothetical protein
MLVLLVAVIIVLVQESCARQEQEMAAYNLFLQCAGQYEMLLRHMGAQLQLCASISSAGSMPSRTRKRLLGDDIHSLFRKKRVHHSIWYTKPRDYLW